MLEVKELGYRTGAALAAGAMGAAVTYGAVELQPSPPWEDLQHKIIACEGDIGAQSLLTNELPTLCAPFQADFIPHGRQAQTLERVRPSTTPTPHTYFYLPGRHDFDNTEYARVATMQNSAQSTIAYGAIVGMLFGQIVYPVGRQSRRRKRETS